MASYTPFEEKIVELQQANQTHKNSQPKIQKVAEHLRNRSNYDKYYSPKLVSIGPIHHGKENLKSGEKYKLMWAAKYIEITSQTLENLLKKIVDNIDELKGLFADDILTLTGESLKGFRSLEEKLSWMLFVDGCSLIYVMTSIWSFNIKIDELILVFLDTLLLENQLPYHVLKLLWINDNGTELEEAMKHFLGYRRLPPSDINQDSCFGIRKYKKKEKEDSVGVLIPCESELPIHLLDLHRKIILNEFYSKRFEKDLTERRITYKSVTDLRAVGINRRITYKSIQDLRAVGIRLTPNKRFMLSDIHFSKGWFAAKLSLPLIIMNNSTAIIFLNQIAYEMCPDFENDYGVSSFAYFMNSLVDHPKDVKELRSSGILVNSVGTDEEVANLFNIIGADLVADIENTYYEVRSKMNDHYENTCKTWIAQGIHKYFSNPWAFIAFLAAFIALVLTFTQTWFTVRPTC